MNWTMPVELQGAIVDGLKALMALRLPGSPALDTITATAKVWITALGSRPITWNAEQDLERVKRTFVELAATADKWPSPKLFMDRLQPRTPQRVLNPPTDTTMSPKTREMIDNLKKRLKRHTPEAQYN